MSVIAPVHFGSAQGRRAGGVMVVAMMLGLGLGLGVAGGCAGGGERTGTRGVAQAASSERAANIQPRNASPRVASPSVRAASRGLELWSWIVADGRVPITLPNDAPPPREAEDDEDAAVLKPPLYTVLDDRLSIEQALAPYIDRPVPLPDHVRFRWHTAGLRIVAVPVSDLAEIQSKLRIVGPIQRQWFGESPSWTELMRGPSLVRPQRIMLDTGSTLIDGGDLRLLGRAWIAPAPTPEDPLAAALRLELVPQHRPQLSETQRLLATAGNSAAESRSRVFSSLALGVNLQGEDALVIIPDAPASDWSAVLESAEEGAPAAEADDAPGSADRSLGEAMLASPAGGSRPRTRAILVLIPHVPQRFELSR